MSLVRLLGLSLALTLPALRAAPPAPDIDFPAELAAVAPLERIPRSQAQHALLVRWFRTDRAAAVAWINQNPTHTLPEIGVPLTPRGHTFRDILQRLPDSEFPLLVELSRDTTHPDLNAAAVWELGDRIPNLPAATAWPYLQAHGWDVVRNVHNMAYARIVMRAAQLPLEDAKAFYRSLPDRLLSHPLVVEFYSADWPLVDPEGALSRAASLKTWNAYEIRAQVHALVADLDPAFAKTRVEAAPPSPDRSDYVTNTVCALAAKNIPDTLAWISTFPPGLERKQALAALAGIASDFDPTAMIKALATLPPGEFHDQAAAPFIQRWLNSNVPAAFDWFVRLPEGDLRNTLRNPVISAVVVHLPERALAHTQALPPSPERNAFIHALAQHQASAHRTAVFALINELPAGRERAGTQNTALRSLARDNPSATAHLLMSGELVTPTAVHVSEVADAWTGSSIDACARWLEALHTAPETAPLAARAIENLSQAYASNDPDAGLAWLERLAERTADERHLRTRVFSTLVRAVARTNPEHARQLVETRDLPASVRQNLLQSLPR